MMMNSAEKDKRSRGQINESKKALIDSMLNQLMGYLNRILSDDNPSELSFEDIHSSCYKVCLNKGELELLNRFDIILTNHLSTIFHKISSLSREEFYEKLLAHYFDYLNKINVIQKTMMYLQNNYLFKKGSTIMIVSKTKFKTFFFKSEFEESLKAFLIENVVKDRKNEYINKILFSNLIKMIKDINDSFYFKMFEEELIKETTAYLKEEYLRQTTLLNSDEYSDFLYTLVNQELSRIQELNISISKQKIIKVHIFECVIPFFQNDQVILALLSKFTKDVGLSKIIRLHEIASYHQNSLDLFFTKLGLAIENTGKSMISLEDITNLQTDQSCLELIKNIILVHDKVEQMKSKLNILSEKKFSSLLNQHFHNFINHPDHKQFFPKCLARYIDIQLKNYKTKLNYDEILIVIEKSLKIFKFIEEKDIFEQFYRRFLATKLLSNIYYEEIEAKIISNLKIECGAIFTHRCEVMINDIKSSENMFSQFRTSKFYINPTKLEFGVKILTQGNWPISSLDSMNITNLDKKNKNFEFIGILDHFRKFFAAFYPGKKINFKMNLGNAEIVAKFSKSLYFLNVSTLQAFICLLMNKYKRLPFKSILEMLQIKEVQIVNSHIIPLIKSGLLVLDDAKPIMNNVQGIAPEIQINMTSIISLNTGFYSKHQKIKFNLSKNNEKIMVAHKQDAIDAERRYHIEASIIRVMKNKKNCEHNDLTNEVIKSLSSSFVPSLFVIKQRIESLIERSYLKRSDKGYNIYTYTD